MIEIRHLTKKYGNRTAVNDLNITFEKGKIYGFLGPNGAGKSTTMNMITGYLASTEGEVLIDGHDILKEAEKAKKKIGYLPENPPLYTDMTVKEYLSFVAELKGIKKADREKAIEDAMNLVKIKDRERQLIKGLSKGYKQRVGFAQAILGMPEIIILDEPTEGLDPKQRVEIKELIKSLGNNHIVILSSHILGEISAVCDYIFVISKGKLVASDTTENLVSKSEGEHKLEVTVKGESETVKKVLLSVDGVKEVRPLDRKEAETVRFQVMAKKNRDVREEMFYALANAKLPVYGMNKDTGSLEDIFLSLTGEGHMEEEREKLQKSVDEMDAKVAVEEGSEQES